MDTETYKLLQELKETMEEKGKPFIHNVLQSVIIALIVAVPTLLITINKFENRMVKLENDKIEDARKMDYNFNIIEKTLNKEHSKDITFFKINE